MENKILDRVRKLLALASNNPSEAEAASAMRMAHKLMAKYNISLSDAEANDADDYTTERTPSPSHAGSKYLRTVANSIAKLYFCRLAVSRIPGVQKETFLFIGRKANVEIAQTIFVLVRKALRNDLRRTGSQGERGFDSAFYCAAASVIWDRCQTMIDEAKRGETVDADTGTALVLASTYAREENAVARYLDNTGVRLGTLRNNRARNLRTDGLVHGADAGQRAQLRATLSSKNRDAIA